MDPDQIRCRFQESGTRCIIVTNCFEEFENNVLLHSKNDSEGSRVYLTIVKFENLTYKKKN